VSVNKNDIIYIPLKVFKIPKYVQLNLQFLMHDCQWNRIIFTRMMPQPCVYMFLHMVVSKWQKGMSLQYLQDSHGQKCKMVEKERNVKDSGVKL